MDFSGQYLTFKEYQELGGTLAEMPFNLLEFKARKEIDKYTFGRLINLPSQIKEVKLCIYDLINKLNNPNENKGIASESTNGYSVSYESTSTETEKAKNLELKNAIYTYLAESKLDDNTPYLYRG